MDTASRPVVVGLGELLWDCFDATRRPGGAPANFAFHAQQLGCRGVVCSRVGRDALGDELLQFLAQQGLGTATIQQDANHPTGSVTVDTSVAGHPSFVIHQDVAWDYLELDKAWRDVLRSAAAVCFGTLAQRNQQSRETIHACLDATAEGCWIIYDVNLRQHWHERTWIEQSLRKANAVKLNLDEVAVLGPLLELGTTDPVEFARRALRQYDVGWVAITRAENGCLVVDAADVVDVPGVPVRVADAVGAGDALTAALIHTRLEGWPLDASARFANEVGALVASEAGAMPPLSDAFARLAEKYAPR